jgi:outer membrane lipoprotein SlyB
VGNNFQEIVMIYRKRLCTLAAAAAVTVTGITGCAYDPYPPYQTTYPGTAPAAPYPNREVVRYGYVESVETVTPDPRASGPGVGAVGGAIAGGVIGHQIGSGSGNTAATIGGAVIGGVVGHQIEQRVRTQREGVAVEYHFRVRMDDGSYQTFRKETHDGIRVGDRVRVERGNIFAV